MELEERELKRGNCELTVDKLIEEERGRLLREKLQQQLLIGNVKVGPDFVKSFY